MVVLGGRPVVGGGHGASSGGGGGGGVAGLARDRPGERERETCQMATLEGDAGCMATLEGIQDVKSKLHLFLYVYAQQDVSN